MQGSGNQLHFLVCLLQSIWPLHSLFPYLIYVIAINLALHVYKTLLNWLLLLLLHSKPIPLKIIEATRSNMQAPMIGSVIATGTASSWRITSTTELLSVINSSSWSLIYWVSCSSSSGAMEEELRELRGANPKYCFMVTLDPVARTRPECSGRPMTAVRRSWSPWGTNKPCDACSYKESCTKNIFV